MQSLQGRNPSLPPGYFYASYIQKNIFWMHQGKKFNSLLVHIYLLNWKKHDKPHLNNTDRILL